SRGTLKMEWSAHGFLVPTSSGEVPAEAIKVCPFNTNPEKEVEDEDALGNLFLSEASNADPRAGRFESCYIGHSRKFRATSSSGGVSTYVLEQLFKRREVDHLFVVRTDGSSGYRYQLCSSLDD